jgi:hypothetical protein
MSQSDTIFAFLFLAYAAFITLRGELPTYAGFLLLAPQGSNTSQAQASNQATLGAIIQGAGIAAATV